MQTVQSTLKQAVIKLPYVYTFLRDIDFVVAKLSEIFHPPKLMTIKTSPVLIARVKNK